MQSLATPEVTEVDGLQLHLSNTNPTGYKNVFETRGGRFEAKKAHAGGNQTYLGTFDTAVEAAIAYARYVQSLESA